MTTTVSMMTAERASSATNKVFTAWPLTEAVSGQKGIQLCMGQLLRRRMTVKTAMAAMPAAMSATMNAASTGTVRLPSGAPWM